MTRFLRDLLYRLLPPRSGFAGTWMGWRNRPLRIVEGDSYQLGCSCRYQSKDVSPEQRRRKAEGA